MGWADDVRKKAALDRSIDRGLAGTPHVLRDEKGRILEAGDEVVLSAPGVCFRIGEIVPVVDPTAPPGLMRMRLVSVEDMIWPAGTTIGGIIRCRTASEFGIVPKAGDPTNQPPAGDPQANQPPPLPDDGKEPN